MFLFVLRGDVTREKTALRAALGATFGFLFGVSAWLCRLWPHLGFYHHPENEVDPLGALLFVSVAGVGYLIVGGTLKALGHFLHGWDVAGPVYRRLAVPARR